MTELQMNRYDALLRRVGDLKGPGSKVSEVLTELFPVLDVERVPGELLALSGTVIAHGGMALTAGGSTSARGQILNPAGSGKLMTVTRCVFGSDTTDSFRFAVTSTVLSAGIGVESPRDSRFGLTTQPSGQIRQEALLALSDATYQIRNLANTADMIEDDNGLAVLAPGSSFEVGMGAQAVTLIAAFWWRERVAEPSELNI